MRKLCFVTTTRADYGLIKRLLRLIADDPTLKLQLIVSGTHLSDAHGKTISEIKKDGFKPDFEIPIYPDSTQADNCQEAFVRGMQGFTTALNALAPDIVVLTGDRYEMLAAAICALIQKVPAAQLFAGDVTEGAFDESIRHSITKMSQIHFTSHEAATRRVCQMGENPTHVFTVGNPGLDGISELSAPDRNSFQAQTGYAPQQKNILVTFHPCTLENDSLRQLDELLKAIVLLQTKHVRLGILFTKPNADPEGNQMAERIRNFCLKQPNCKLVASLGHELYFSAIQLCDAVVGNSSSGIYEVPLFKKPTVNIGDRQKGRPQARSILNCRAESSEIIASIESAWTLDCSGLDSLYGDGHSSQRIYDVLKAIKNPQELIKKRFFDQPEPYATQR